MFSQWFFVMTAFFLLYVLVVMLIKVFYFLAYPKARKVIRSIKQEYKQHLCQIDYYDHGVDSSTRCDIRFSDGVLSTLAVPANTLFGKYCHVETTLTGYSERELNYIARIIHQWVQNNLTKREVHFLERISSFNQSI